MAKGIKMLRNKDKFSERRVVSYFHTIIQSSTTSIISNDSKRTLKYSNNNKPNEKSQNSIWVLEEAT